MGSHAPPTVAEGPTPALSSQRMPPLGSGSALHHRTGRVFVLASCLTGYASAFLPSPAPLTRSSSLISTTRVSTRRYFKAPEPIPSVNSLEKNATWSFGFEPSDDKDDFIMPWLTLENTGNASASNISKLFAQPGNPALFVSRLGAWNVSDRPEWLRPVNLSALTEPEAEHRVMTYKAPTRRQSIACSLRRRFSPFPLFTRQVPVGSVLVGSISGDELSLQSESSGGGLSKLFAEPPVGWIEPVSPFVKAAHDPRVKAMIIRIGPLACGYGKLVELRRHMEYFKASGKTLVAYMDSGAEKEYYAALACDEIYMPPGGSLRLQGFVSSASFLRGVLDKVGLEPVVVRIGKYKSAGDTINLEGSTDAFREVQGTLLNQTAEHWVQQVASDLNKTSEEVRALWETPMSEPVKLAHNKFITAPLYYDQVKEVICQRYKSRRSFWHFRKKPARAFGVRPFLRVVGSGKKVLPGLPGCQGPRVAVINAAGSIAASGSPITATELNELLKEVEEDSGVKAVVLRIDSPGGDALTSELIWRRILKLRSIKPVVASMVDVAASGGYFLAMGCNAIVAEETTITGSIGVVAILFKLRALFDKIGLNEESMSIGRYAKFFVPGHTLSEDEREMFEKDVWSSYQDFVGKAAFCRNFTWDQAHDVAQGRVWRGTDAKERGLVDVHGGVWRAVEVAKRLAKIEDKKETKLMVVKGERSRLFGSRGRDEADDAAIAGQSDFNLLSPQPMAVADEQVEMYFRAVGAEVPGEVLGGKLGLGGSAALLQRLGKPLADKILKALL